MSQYGNKKYANTHKPSDFDSSEPVSIQSISDRFDTDDDRLQESGHGQIVSGKRGPAYNLDK